MMEESAKASKKRKKSSKSKAKAEPEERASPKKRKKDPNAPKKARSAYQLYANSVREEIKAENPDKSFGEQTKIMATKWKELGEEDKAAWQEKAETDKARFKDAMADYEPPSDVEVTPKKGKGKKGKAAKDPNAPKRATTAYFFFLADTRETAKAENPGLSVTELSKVIGAKWKELTPEEKSKFEEKAKADKERYAEEVAAYKGKKAAEEDPMEEDDSSDAGSDSD
uniref:HMG box domain-containing protein n=1 Tax=Florenciella parvula TaxID=236787 RepID=A0A7S2CA52_9STRA|mmetsp:Transcript_26525/g.54646  ORF Transcript_26525/g.54646 Transcript_26525/m.54646 type:complete len:226 (+) Transcript_26525:329-1006(+)